MLVIDRCGPLHQGSELGKIPLGHGLPGQLLDQGPGALVFTVQEPPATQSEGYRRHLFLARATVAKQFGIIGRQTTAEEGG